MYNNQDGKIRSVSIRKKARSPSYSKLSPEDVDFIRKYLLEKDPVFTLNEIVELVKDCRGIDITRKTVTDIRDGKTWS